MCTVNYCIGVCAMCAHQSQSAQLQTLQRFPSFSNINDSAIFLWLIFIWLFRIFILNGWSKCSSSKNLLRTITHTECFLQIDYVIIGCCSTRFEMLYWNRHIRSTDLIGAQTLTQTHIHSQSNWRYLLHCIKMQIADINFTNVFI